MTANADTQAWDDLAARIDALVTAWESAGEPPDLVRFLPAGGEKVRLFALVELIKVDLEFRWRVARKPKLLEDYGAEFPELIGAGRYPNDLVYEEFHVRRQCGDAVRAEDVLARFPAQRDELAVLLGFEAPEATTSLRAVKPMARFQPGDRVDDFDLLAELGEGAFAKVFLARQRSMQRLVALKVSAIRGEEHKTLAQLDHPHIVRVYSQQTLDAENLRLLYMQYLAGGTLHQVVAEVRARGAGRAQGRLLLDTVRQALEARGETPPAPHGGSRALAASSWPLVVCWIGAKLASALAYAHERGVLHRDIKPANVLLAADGSPKLADFNISFSKEVQGSSPAAYFGGSLAYMSPEQLEACNPFHGRRPEDLDGRSDLFSLGVMLWELLTGERPWRDTSAGEYGGDLLASMIARREDGVPPASRRALPADVPAGLEEVLLTCLAPRREDRFESARQLARQLEWCQLPHVQNLLRPAPSRARTAVLRETTAWLLLIAVAANAVLSGLNISYNWTEIVKLSQYEVFEVFEVQLGTVNAVAYGLGLLVMTGFMRRVGRITRRRFAGEPLTPEEAAFARQRSLWIGDVGAGTGLALWVACGVVFPTGIHLATGDAPLVNFAHFAVSHLLCGTIAGTLVFFLTNFLVVRWIYPSLLDPNREAPEGAAELNRLGRRTLRYFALSVCLPLVSVLVAVFFTENKLAYGALAGMGLAGFAVSYLATKAIRWDLAALLLAVSSDGPIAASNNADEAVWGDSFRA